MVSKDYKSRGIYFDSSSEQQMDVYNFLGALSSSRILTPFITELILEFVKKKSRKNINKLTKKECVEIAKYFMHAINTEQPEQSSQTQLLLEAMQTMLSQINSDKNIQTATNSNENEIDLNNTISNTEKIVVNMDILNAEMNNSENSSFGNDDNATISTADLKDIMTW